MIDAISRVRGVPAECLVPGAGSSDLIYPGLPQVAFPEARACFRSILRMENIRMSPSG